MGAHQNGLDHCLSGQTRAGIITQGYTQAESDTLIATCEKTLLALLRSVHQTIKHHFQHQHDKNLK